MTNVSRIAMTGLLPAFLATGCSSPKKVPTPPQPASVSVDLQVQAGPRINPDPSGNPLSVVVRFYQLKDVAEFSKITLEQANSDKPAGELLGPDLVASAEFVVVPGATLPRTESLRPETRYLAAVALFRQPDPFFWRIVIPASNLRAAQKKLVTLKVNENKLVVEGTDIQLLPGQPAPGKS